MSSIALISRFNEHLLHNSEGPQFERIHQHRISFLLHCQSCVTQDIQLPLSFPCTLALRFPDLPWTLLNASEKAFAITSDFSVSLQMKA